MMIPLRSLLFIFWLAPLFTFGQKTLVLETERPGKVKQRIFYLRDPISLKLNTGKRCSGIITAIGDSAILLQVGKHVDTVSLRSVRAVIFGRSNHITHVFSKAFLTAGLLVIALDATNNLINGEHPVFKSQVIVVGASLVGAAALLKLYERKKVRLGKRKRLKVIELTPI